MGDIIELYELIKDLEQRAEALETYLNSKFPDDFKDEANQSGMIVD